MMSFSLLPSDSDECFWCDNPVSCTAFRVKEIEELLEGINPDRVPEECTLAANGNQTLVTQFIQVMGEG